MLKTSEVYMSWTSPCLSALTFTNCFWTRSNPDQDSGRLFLPGLLFAARFSAVLSTTCHRQRSTGSSTGWAWMLVWLLHVRGCEKDSHKQDVLDLLQNLLLKRQREGSLQLLVCRVTVVCWHRPISLVANSPSDQHMHATRMLLQSVWICSAHRCGAEQRWY